MKHDRYIFQVVMSAVYGDYLRGDIPYVQPSYLIPDGFMPLEIAWEGTGPVKILWPDGDLLPFDDTHDQYMVNLRYVFADCKLPYAWKYEP